MRSFYRSDVEQMAKCCIEYEKLHLRTVSPIRCSQIISKWAQFSLFISGQYNAIETNLLQLGGCQLKGCVVINMDLEGLKQRKCVDCEYDIYGI